MDYLGILKDRERERQKRERALLSRKIKENNGEKESGGGADDFHRMLS